MARRIAMNECFVLGAILRVDLCGWNLPPPRLPRDPIAIEEGPQGGVVSFIYDLLPKRICLAAPDACERLGATILALLEVWPFRDLDFPARCRLDLGVVVDDPQNPWRLDWPVAFLAALADAEIELGLSVYPSRSETAET
jgi:hypothetical protein